MFMHFTLHFVYLSNNNIYWCIQYIFLTWVVNFYYVYQFRAPYQRQDI